MYAAPLASTGTVRTPSLAKRSLPVESFNTSTALNGMPFFERNSFARRQLLQPGWVNKMNGSETLSISMELDATLYSRRPINDRYGLQPHSSARRKHAPI
jgi:hypothetical protein